MRNAQCNNPHNIKGNKRQPIISLCSLLSCAGSLVHHTELWLFPCGFSMCSLLDMGEGWSWDPPKALGIAHNTLSTLLVPLSFPTPHPPFRDPIAGRASISLHPTRATNPIEPSPAPSALSPQLAALSAGEGSTRASRIHWPWGLGSHSGVFPFQDQGGAGGILFPSRLLTRPAGGGKELSYSALCCVASPSALSAAVGATM